MKFEWNQKGVPYWFFSESKILKMPKIVASVAILGSPLVETEAMIFWTLKIVASVYLIRSLAFESIKKIVASLSSPLGETEATIFQIS